MYEGIFGYDFVKWLGHENVVIKSVSQDLSKTLYEISVVKCVSIS